MTSAAIDSGDPRPTGNTDDPGPAGRPGPDGEDPKGQDRTDGDRTGEDRRGENPTAIASVGELWPAGHARLAPSARLRDVTDMLRTLSLDAGQQAVRTEMISFAEANDDALVRTCAPGHFTGSALVVDAAQERTLLLFHRKLQRWLQPGGHADGDANLASVALKEAGEETGIEGLVVDPVAVDLDIHEIGAGKDPAHLHLDARFLVIAPADSRVRGNHESEELRWVTVSGLADLDLDAGTHRLVAAGMARARRHFARA